MKVVLFCGGLGLRMREVSESVPKPMVPIGANPMLWHIMKYYAHFGHTEFILCLGHKQEAIKEYFLNYREAMSNDFVYSHGGKIVDVIKSDIENWKITFVDTGLHAKVGQRLKAVQPYLEGDDVFLANYGDTLTDAPLPQLIDRLTTSDNVASFLCVKPNWSFHVVDFDHDNGRVAGLRDAPTSEIWINGGYFVLRREIFDYLHEGEDLVEAPFLRLIDEGRLLAHRYEGFWAPMDSLKDKQELDALNATGQDPWRVWRDPSKDSAGADAITLAGA